MLLQMIDIKEVSFSYRIYMQCYRTTHYKLQF